VKMCENIKMFMEKDIKKKEQQTAVEKNKS
jgi:hypothetical protein